jgi:hypothetical protein
LMVTGFIFSVEVSSGVSSWKKKKIYYLVGQKGEQKMIILLTFFSYLHYDSVHVDSNQRKKIFFKVCNSLYQEALLKYSQAQKVWPIMLVGDFESTTLLWQKIISQFKKVFVS